MTPQVLRRADCLEVPRPPDRRDPHPRHSRLRPERWRLPLVHGPLERPRHCGERTGGLTAAGEGASRPDGDFCSDAIPTCLPIHCQVAQPTAANAPVEEGMRCAAKRAARPSRRSRHPRKDERMDDASGGPWQSGRPACPWGQVRETGSQPRLQSADCSSHHSAVRPQWRLARACCSRNPVLPGSAGRDACTDQAACVPPSFARIAGGTSRAAETRGSGISRIVCSSPQSAAYSAKLSKARRPR